MSPSLVSVTVFLATAPADSCHLLSLLFVAIQVSEESAEAWVDEFTASGPDFQQAKAAVEVREECESGKAERKSSGLIGREAAEGHRLLTG